MTVANDAIGCKEAGTLWGLFCERVRRSPDRVAYQEYDAVAKIWRNHSWCAIAARVDRFRSALARAGLKPGDRLGILLPNGIDWVCADVAGHAAGLVVVGLYPHDNAANNAYILGHSDARLVLLDTQARWQSLSAHRAVFRALEHTWIRSDSSGSASSDPSVRRLDDVLAEDADLPPAQPVASTSLATLIYTSGTTGRPKGVMLSHFAILWNAEASARIIPPRPDDVFLSVLPLAHAFERTVGYYLPMMGGSAVAYARSPQDLPEDLIVVRPTVLLGVPLLFERMFAAIRAKAERSVAKRMLLQLAAALGWRRFEARRQRDRGLRLGTLLLWPVLARLVAAPVMAAFGGRLRVAVSGGAPLEAGIGRFLIGLGIPLTEGYGLSEAAPVVSANSLDDNLPGSVGRPLIGVDVRLTGEGELLVHTPSVMTGYWKDAPGTTDALDAAGWLATGDAGEIRDGYIFIRGRLNEMIVLSIGEKVNPNVVEAEIMRDALFEQAAVFGSGRPYLVAVIVLNKAAWQHFAAQQGADPDRPNDPSVKTAILARIEKVLAELPRYAQVRAVHLSFELWTIDAGLLTPTLKIKREVIQRVFADAIAELYAGP